MLEEHVERKAKTMELVVVVGMAIAMIMGVLILLATSGDSGSKNKTDASQEEAIAPGEDLGAFSKKPLLNASETRLAKEMVRLLEAAGGGRQILTQVSYGEFLKGVDKAAHARINQKRADFLIVDEQYQVLAVVEYQGAGHYGRGEAARVNAQKRDRIKRHACATAGIPFLEIPATYTPKQLEEWLTGIA